MPLLIHSNAAYLKIYFVGYLYFLLIIVCIVYIFPFFYFPPHSAIKFKVQLLKITWFQLNLKNTCVMFNVITDIFELTSSILLFVFYLSHLFHILSLLFFSWVNPYVYYSNFPIYQPINNTIFQYYFSGYPTDYNRHLSFMSG